MIRHDEDFEARRRSPPDPFADDRCIDTVPFVPFTCPKCGRKPQTGGVAGRIRYHYCRPCNYRYRSLQIEATEVRGFEKNRE